MKLIDIVTPALVIFERVVSGTLKNDVINEKEFNMLQTLHLETLNKLTGVSRAMEAEHMSLVQKPTGRDKQYKEKHRNKKLIVCSLCYFACHFKNG